MLWIGGALLLSRLGAYGPKIMLFFFKRTPLLSDVKRGLQNTGLVNLQQGYHLSCF